MTDFSEEEDLINFESNEGSIDQVSNNLEGPEWQGLSPQDQVKKFNISSKLFKLRYLCKYHLQLCAVLSQLTKHKEALHQGMLAAFYCQELIRNTHLLCQNYITKLQTSTAAPKEQNTIPD